MGFDAIFANAITYGVIFCAGVLALLFYRAKVFSNGLISLRITKIVRRLKEFYDNFYYSYFYPLFVCLVALFFWLLGSTYLGIAAMVLISLPVFLVKRDVSPIYTPLFACLMLFRSLDATNFITFYTILLPAAICLIARFFIHPIKQVFIGKLIFPLILVSAAIALGGVLSPYVSQYFTGLAHVVSLGVGMLFIYFWFSNYTDVTAHEDFKKYFTFSFLYPVLLAGAEMCLIRAFKTLGVNFYMYHWTTVGWAHFNQVGFILLLGIPLCFYLTCNAKYLFPYFIAIAFLYLAIFQTGSDGTLAVSACFLPILLGFTYFRMRKDKRYAYLAYLTAIVCAIMLFMIIRADTVSELTDKLIKAFYNDVGRTKLYQEAVRLFTLYPVFGVGFGYTNLALFNQDFFNFHSLFFQIIGTMGIFGIGAYIVMYVCRIRILIRKNTNFNFYAFLSFILFFCYASVDCGEFAAIPLMIMVTLLILAVELDNERDSVPLPLTKLTY